MNLQDKFNKSVSEKAIDSEFYGQMTDFANSFSKQKQSKAGIIQHPENAKKRGAFYRWRTTENLDKHLIEFESNFLKKGGKVIWAPDEKDIQKEVALLLAKYNNYDIEVSHSPIFEEAGLYNALSNKPSHSAGIEATLCGEKRAYSHPVFPLAHVGKEKANVFFNEFLGLKARTETKYWAEYYRDKSISKTINKSIAFVSPQFALTDSGSLVFVGNNGLQTSLVMQSNIIVALVGIDQMVATKNELETLLPLLSVYGQAEALSRQLLFVGGPKQSSFDEGPEEIYIILFDNGRSNTLSKPAIRQSSHCIQCGACHMVCPVFRMVGAESYRPANAGPIGKVTSQQQYIAKEMKHLSFASTHCGACTEVCPVKIDIHSLIVNNRKDSQETGHAGANEKYLWLAWKRMMLKRKRMNQTTSLKSFMFRTAFRKNWGEKREFPQLVERSFNQMWVEQFGSGQED
ncbi:MAG: LUD domain-containing protein [Bacteroidota bacterium]|nr:LUD domain-containing protein [Bacteroidota bacterium]